tara:strand:- start:464 stop:718 length:255 start_codon:yes stop_codon:yes gene_type:complete
MDEEALRELRLECLRLAVEFGSARDFKEPDGLAERYYQFVMQGSGKLCECRPEDSRKDGGPKKAKNSRNVRKGSEPQTQTTMLT